MSSQFLLSRCEELLAESVAMRLQPCGTGVPRCFDEHASLDTSQSQAQRDSATLKATHDDSVVTCRHCFEGSKGMRPIHQHRDPRFHLARISWSGTVGHTEQLKHQSLKLLCYKLLFRKPYSRVHFMRSCEVTMTTVGFMAWASFGPFKCPKVYFSQHCETWDKNIACDGASSRLVATISNSGYSECGRIRHYRARSETCCAACHTTQTWHSLERM